MQVSQADFAKLMDVSRKTVTVWKKRGRIIMVGELVNVEASRERMARYSTSGSKAFRGATKPLPESNDGAEQVTAAAYDPPAYYDNPANLPEHVIDISVCITEGASDMARAIRPHLPAATVRALVDGWVQQQRASFVGGPGLPSPISDEDHWPEPPVGFGRWSDHPLFTRPALTDLEWREIETEAEAGV